MLTTAQIKAMRSLDPSDEYRPQGLVIAPRTLSSLRKRRLVSPTALTLTSWGKRWIDSYVRSTGNGPEDLKAMFRL